MMETKNAIITNATLTTEDHGILSSWITLDYGGSGQGFGGFALQLSKTSDHWTLEGPAGHFIWRVLEIAGVHDWGKLQGKTIRVRADHGVVKAIGHVIKDDWFEPAVDFAGLK